MSRTHFWRSFSSVRVPSLNRFGDDDGGDGGDGGGDIQSQITAAVEAATAGLKTKNSELLGESKKAKAEAAKLGELFESLGGEDGIKALQSLQKKVSEDATLKLINEGKWEEVLEQKTAKMREAHEKALQTAQGATADAEAKAKAAVDKLHGTLLEVDARRACAASEGFQSDALVDVLNRARSVFNAFNENTGKPEIHDEDGNAVLGADGKSAITMDEWLESQKESARHWWAPSRGSGAGGSSAGGGGSDDVSRITDQRAYEERRRKDGAGKSRFS